MIRKKYIKIVIVLILMIILIIGAYFFFFNEKKYFLLYIEGLDKEILNQYSAEKLPNLKKLYQSDLNSEISLNLESSFLTILSGEYKYISTNDKDLTEYSIIKKDIDNLDLFYQTDLYQHVRGENLSFKFSEKDLKQEKFKEKVIIYLSRIENNDLNSYQKIDNLIREINKKLSFNTKLLVVFPMQHKTTKNINQVLADKGFLTCPENFQDLSECDLANSFAYSPVAGEVYINKKDREKLGRVDWDYEEVIEDTIYSLNYSLNSEEQNNENQTQFDKNNFQIYKSQKYFKEKNIPEIFVFKDSNLKTGLIFSNKKFVQNEYDYLEILNLIIDDK